jgi:NitT/TauT family transport system substrate-binding protein
MKRLASTLLVALILIPGIGLPADVLKIGAIPIADHLPLHTAKFMGYFKDQGIQMDIKFMRGGSVILPALIGGSVDLGDSAYTQLFMARDQGFELMAIVPYGRVTPGAKKDASVMVVRTDSGIRGPKDLEGKKIAVITIKSPNWLYGYEWMSRNGANPKKAIWVEIPFPRMFPALRGKQVDALFGTEPFVTVELEKGGVKAIGYPFMEVDPRMEVSGVMAKEEWIRSHQELVGRFAAAFKKAIAYLRSHAEKRPELVDRCTRIKPELVARIKMHEPHFPLDLESLQAHSDMALKWGLIRKKQDVRHFVWPTALR